jgi:hypothetical protein
VRFEDDSVEAAKVVKQWNIKIVYVSTVYAKVNVALVTVKLGFALR